MLPTHSKGTGWQQLCWPACLARLQHADVSRGSKAAAGAMIDAWHSYRLFSLHSSHRRPLQRHHSKLYVTIQVSNTDGTQQT